MSGKQQFAGILDQTRTAGAQLREGLSSIRKRISDLKGKKAEIEAIPCDAAEAHARIDDLVEGWIIELRQRHGFAAPSKFIASPSLVGNFDYVSLEPNLAAYLLPALAAAMKAEASKALQDAPGISAHDRATRLATIERDLLDAEMTEESIIRAAEAAGFPVSRRGSADPRAVLASDEALP